MGAGTNAGNRPSQGFPRSAQITGNTPWKPLKRELQRQYHQALEGYFYQKSDHPFLACGDLQSRGLDFGARPQAKTTTPSTNMPTIIRPEEPRDVPAIELVTIEAFKHAPHTDHTEQFIVRDLRLANALTVSMVAEANEQIIGHVAISPIQISNGADAWFGLGPISVLPAHQGRGIGTQLMEAALQQLQETSARGCVVLGDPNYYGRFGFAQVAGLVLTGVPSEYFQAMSLNSDFPQGEVTYHPAFEAKA